MLVSMAPADWPKTVMLLTSPPNAGDVVVDPVERENLVHEAVVAGSVMGAIRP